MIKHTKIRTLIIDGIKAHIPNINLYDGRPVNFDESELPVIAVYLTEPHPDSNYLDSNQWMAILHVELFLKAAKTDSDLDKWVEEKLYPAIESISNLGDVLTDMTPKGFDYDRDDEMALWASVDLTYQIEYEM
ncbi:phage tail terminator protein [Providencia heimbachae]|uniref:Phage minor tail protein U n=1 Tax=Providencia heimbachae ATCC 35613 TaxID=1354272 RepID=A0A1B7JGM3_9GAMM|nr:phage tail terminator protein [Providencia heimbachae]OAT47006.1 phage minor tail protein U [Providencia heimbachae ATCC 35613]SQH13026.1 Phage minor tail protein U [Providencia heimbachae]